MKQNKILHSFSNTLRKEMTPWERKLWFCFLKDYKTKFRRQQIINDFIVDFYCSKFKIVIELDGSGHYEQEKIISDKLRDENLKKLNYKVLRFTNTDIDKNFKSVCEYIDNVVNSIIVEK